MSYGIKRETYESFTDEELCEIFEFARDAMCDGNICAYISEKMDLTDGYILKLRGKLEAFMNKEAYDSPIP